MIYLALFLFSFMMTYFIKNYAIKNSHIAYVNERSSHSQPTPHGGGVAIAVTWFIGLFYLYVSDRIESELFYALLVGILLSVVSYLDDLFELSAKIRLVVHAIVAFLGLYVLGGFREIDLFFFTVTNPIISNLFAFFMFIWFINLYNFLDGIDGYAGSEALFLSLSGFVLFGGAYFLVLAAAVLGFLVWNWHRAKIFMGDVGSTLLGYNIAVFTIYYANEDAQNFWVWIILFGVFWFDATVTLLRRKRNAEKLSQAHKKHAYQRLVQYGWSHSKVVLASVFVNIVLFMILQTFSNIFLAFVVSIFFLYVIMRYIDRKKAFV